MQKQSQVVLAVFAHLYNIICIRLVIHHLNISIQYAYIRQEVLSYNV
jgi:hypothetical protein